MLDIAEEVYHGNSKKSLRLWDLSEIISDYKITPRPRQKFLKDLGSRVSEATGEKRAKSFLFQSLSMNLQRGNALCVMGTVAHHRKLEEIYNLGTIQTQEQEG